MVAEPEESRIEAERLDLRDNDRVVLELLRSEPSAAVGFQGLRRRLRLHPERLSRALHRLAEDDLVVRTELGYRISPRGLAIISPDAFPRDAPGVPVLQAYLPGDVDLRSLTLALKGSWIGPLRWYAFSEGPGEMEISWVTEDDGIQLDARLRPGELTIMAVASAPERLDEASRLGHLLFQHIAREVSRDFRAGLSG